MTMSIKTYSELIKIPTFEDRYRYLRLGGRVGNETFGFDRYLNQIFYKSSEWLEVRDFVIVRDLGCDLGCAERDIPENVPILIHHMNPISKKDILERKKEILDPEFLITTTQRTHNAIHYGDDSLIFSMYTERTMNDTCPWK